MLKEISPSDALSDKTFAGYYCFVNDVFPFQIQKNPADDKDRNRP
jgi:hypothetical protein